MQHWKALFMGAHIIQNRSSFLLAVDIDECLIDNGGCSQVCKNLNGSFLCLCLPGFDLINKKTCIGKFV